MSEEKIKKAITNQLSANRDAMAENFNRNVSDFNCIISKDKNPMTLIKARTSESYSFTQIRKNLVKLQGLQVLYDSNTIKDREADSYFEAERCLLERHSDRAETNHKIDSTIGSGFLTVVSFGVGGVVGSIKNLGGLKNFSFFKHPIVGSMGTLPAIITTATLQAISKECFSQQKDIIELLEKADLPKENLCSTNRTPLEQAKEALNNCAMTVLLSTPALLALPALGRTIATFVEPLKALKVARRPVANEHSVEIVHWNSQGHFDLLVNGKIYGTNLKIPNGTPITKRHFNMMAISPSGSNERIKIAVSAQELKQIEANAIDFAKKYGDMLKSNSVGKGKYGLKRLMSGEGMLCSGVVCGLVGDATGYYVPRGVREFPHLAAAYLKARKAMGDGRIISIETSGKFNAKEYLKSRDMRDNLMFAGGALIITYINKDGDKKEISVPIEEVSSDNS